MSKLWRCPECDTINQDRKCVVCGYENADYKKQTVDAQQTSKNQQQTAKETYVQDSLEMQNESKNSGSKAIMKLLIKPLAALSIILATFAMGFYANMALQKNDDSEIEIPNITLASLEDVEEDSDVITSITTLADDESTTIDETTQSIVKMLSVPNLVGTSKSEAIAAIESAGLTYELSSAESDTIEKDYIISQNVPADASVPANFSILLTVSEGKKIIVPSVINKSIVEAKSILDKAGISYSIEYVDDSRVDKDYVFKQSIKSGTKIDAEKQITIYVSSHENTTVVPNVLKKSYSDAISELKKSKLTYKIVYEDDDRVNYGYVFSQSIKSGKEVKEGTEVTISVSNHENTTIVPNVLNKSYSDAISELKASKLAYKIVYEDDDRANYGYVFRQSIKSGKKVKEGTEVTIGVSTHVVEEAPVNNVTSITNNDYLNDTDTTAENEGVLLISSDYVTTEVNSSSSIVIYSNKNNNVTYKLVDSAIVKFNEGEWQDNYCVLSFTGIKKGSTTLVISLKDNPQISKTINITVNDEEVEFIEDFVEVEEMEPEIVEILAETTSQAVDDVKLSVGTTEVTMEKGEIKYITVTAIGSHGLKIEKNFNNIVKASWVSPWDGDGIRLKLIAKNSGKTTVKIYLTKYPDLYETINVIVN